MEILNQNGVNTTSIESKPSQVIYNNIRENNFMIDIEGTIDNLNVTKAIGQLKEISKGVEEIEPPTVPWFPTKLTDLDYIGFNYQKVGVDFEAVDHASFTDKEYLKRREYIASCSLGYKLNDEVIPEVKYNENETGTWKAIYP